MSRVSLRASRAIALATLAALCAASLASCGKKVPSSAGGAEKPFRIAYAEELKALEKSFAKESQADIDESVGYSPGYVAKLPLEKIAFEPSLGEEVVQGEYLVQLKKGENADDLIRYLRAHRIEASIVGCVPTFDIYQVRAADPGEETLEQLKKLKIVQDAFYHCVRQTQEAQAPVPAGSEFWHIVNYGIDAAWRLGEGKGATIAVIDTGIDPDPLLFQDRIVHPYSVLTRSAAFEDGAYAAGGDRLRVIGHGTQVASIAAGSYPEKGYSGLAPKARVMPIQAFGYDARQGKMLCSDMALLESLARAIAFRADVINLSIGTDYAPLRQRYALGDGPFSEEAYRTMELAAGSAGRLYGRAFDACKSRGIYVVCSAGNDGETGESQPIASDPMVISVGAIDSSNIVGRFSDRGAGVSCYAPGVGVPVVAAGGSVFTVSGTSYSAPYVSGIVAIAKGAGLPGDPARYRHALSSTAYESRSSLFPDGAVRVFDPLSFLRALGGKVEVDGPLAAPYAFYEKYGDLFIEEGEPDMAAFGKIMAYYSRRKAFYDGERESDWAVQKARENFDAVFQDILDDKPYCYYEAITLASSPLSPERVERAAQHIQDSDYMSLILNHQRYAKALPGMLERLERRKTDFNGNTLIGIWNYADRGVARSAALGYLRYSQSNYPAFRYDEDTACLVAAKTSTYPDPDLLSLLLRSRKRLVAAGMYDDSCDLGMALVAAGSKSGVSLLLDTLGRLDGKESDDLALTMRLQKTLNSSIDLGVSYSYEDAPALRNATRSEIRKRLKSAAFADGVFIRASLIKG